ncbi:MAG: ABC transporter ATP-binding protein/permease [Lachnospiraceae bacterium]|nr:ABC transporter ATP-binding protein/permease [Lachnospiraceae bacterium]
MKAFDKKKKTEYTNTDYKDTRSIMKRILEYIRPYTLSVLCSLLLAGVTVALTLMIPILIGRGVDCIVGKGQVDFRELQRIAIQILVLVAVSAACQWEMNHINNTITYHIVNDMRRKTFSHLQRLPLSYIDGQQAGDLLSRIITDVEAFSDGLLMGFTQLFTGVLTIAGTIVFMITISPWITLVVIILTPFSFSIAKFISGKSYNMFQKQSAARGTLTGLTNEMMTGMKVVQAFGYGHEAQRQFDSINDELAEYSLQATFLSSLTNPSTRFYNSLIYAGVTIAGCFAALAGPAVLSIGQLTSFLSYTNQYAKPFNEITGIITEFQNSLASAGRVFELLEQMEESPDPEEESVASSMGETDPVTVCDENPMIHSSEEYSDRHRLRGAVSLSHVNFSYDPSVHLIEDLNLDVNPGQRIAIVGPTGCGKTTLINLLMRFYDVDQGSITVDGRDIRSMSRTSLRSGYGMVLQETWLKSGTIRDNIAYGNPDASMEEIIEAAKKAHAHSFIKRLPDGYDTVLGEDSGSLSQGQKQLICIARIMLTHPPMLILDEATSSIDTMTEIRIQKAFSEMMEGRTSFVVAHRLSTIKEADCILVMKDGHIIEQGNHEELLKKKGFYENLYRSQFVPS